MATLQDFRNERLRKLEELKKLDVNPYPANSKHDLKLKEVSDKFEELKDQHKTVVGRVKSIRDFGKIAFLVIRDDSGDLQLFLRADSLGSAEHSNSELNFGEINLLDTGDFVEAEGKIIKTQTGEISLEVNKLRILTKALRPLPSEQEGFTNKEERLRRRYIDMNVNKDVHDRFIRRSKFWQATRDFLIKEDFIEINVPVLEHTTGGADAKPFKTHMDAINQDFYLRISHELPLKRLIGAGYEKVFDIGARFRNENYSDEHLPEHVAMEWYWAYADWRDGMKMMEGMFSQVLSSTFGTLKFKVHGHEVDMEKPWEQWDYADTIKKRYGLDIYNCSLEDVKRLLKENSLEVEKTENKARGIDKLWKNIRKDVAGPVWLINTPTFISPLSKVSDENPDFVQRFQAVIAGTELCNGWSELNDPIDQLSRFLEQEKMRQAGDDEAQMLDIDYVEMLEYGMPPTCGLGYSERVFWMFEGVTAREGVPFPQLRAEVDAVTKATYPEVFSSKAQAKTLQSQVREQDFSHRIVAVVNDSLEPWQVTNAVAHMTAIIGNELDKEELTSGDYFVGSDEVAIPRNSQYPIIIKKANNNELHKLFAEVSADNLLHHVFIKEMQDTTNDQEISAVLDKQPIVDTTFYGVTFFADNELADKLAKKYQLFK